MVNVDEIYKYIADMIVAVDVWLIKSKGDWLG